MTALKAPFPYFGGKSRVASLVWERFGAVRNYVEPFFGSGAVLLGRPLPFDGVETVNDADGLLANFWRALQSDPDAVANHADWPVNENDLHARHAWLVGQKDTLQARLEGDPEFFDAKVAGWWVWGLCGWIGSGWCSGQGPWHVVDGRLVNAGNAGRGVNRQLPHLGDAGRGVNRITHRDLQAYMRALSERLRRVRVCCGDWSRVCGDSVARGCKGGKFELANFTCGIFLDPPYADTANRHGDLYRVDSQSVAHDVREWALSKGDDPRYRIALCGYEGEHAMPDSWECVAWKTAGGMGNIGNKGRDGTANYKRERIWFSPHCVKPQSERLPLMECV